MGRLYKQKDSKFLVVGLLSKRADHKRVKRYDEKERGYRHAKGQRGPDRQRRARQP